MLFSLEDHFILSASYFLVLSKSLFSFVLYFYHVIPYTYKFTLMYVLIKYQLVKKI